MHVPMQVDYGVRALVELATRREQGLVRASEIAERQGIPESFLAHVLHSLQRHGLTVAQRGPQGGHGLAVEPGAITMGMVMRYLDGAQSLMGCLDDAGCCDRSPGCGQRNVWLDVEEAMWRVLDSTTIADLVERGPAGSRTSALRKGDAIGVR